MNLQIVKNLSKSITVGNDFCHRHSVAIDSGQKTMNIASNVILLKNKHDIHSEQCLVRTVNKVLIPPKSVVDFAATVSQKLVGQNIVVTPIDNANVFHDQPGLMMPNLEVTPVVNVIPVSVVNRHHAHIQ